MSGEKKNKALKESKELIGEAPQAAAADNDTADGILKEETFAGGQAEQKAAIEYIEEPDKPLEGKAIAQDALSEPKDADNAPQSEAPADEYAEQNTAIGDVEESNKALEGKAIAQDALSELKDADNAPQSEAPADEYAEQNTAPTQTREISEVIEKDAVSDKTDELVGEKTPVKETQDIVKALLSVSAEESEADAEEKAETPGGEAVTVDAPLETFTDTESEKEQDAESAEEQVRDSVKEQDSEAVNGISSEEFAKQTMPSAPEANNAEGGLITSESEADKVDKKEKKEKKPNKFVLFVKKHKLFVIIAAIVLLLGAGAAVTHFIMTKDMVFIHKAEDLLSADKGNLLVFKADIAISDSLTVEGYSFDMNGHTLTVNGTLTINGAAGKAIDIGNKKRKQFLEGGAIKADTLIFNGTSSTAYVRSDVSADFLQLNTSGVELYGSIKGKNIADCTASITNAGLAKLYSPLSGDLTLGDAVSLDLYGSAYSIDNGKTVTAYDKAVCASISNADKAVIYPESKVDNISGVEDCVFVEYLAAPDLLIVKEAEGFVCYVSKVLNADFYDYSIEGYTGNIAAAEASFILPALAPGQYSLSVTAGSTNESYNSARATRTVSVHYTVKLAKPVIRVEAGDGTVSLVIEEVDHATEYVYTINGREFNPVNAGTLDITEFVSEVGQYTVHVFARNTADSSYEQSDTAMTSYINKIVLAMSEVTVADKGNGTFTASWASVENADYYMISENGVITYTRSTNYTFSASSITISVKGRGFYTDSAPVTVNAGG